MLIFKWNSFCPSHYLWLLLNFIHKCECNYCYKEHKNGVQKCISFYLLTKVCQNIINLIFYLIILRNQRHYKNENKFNKNCHKNY